MGTDRIRKNIMLDNRRTSISLEAAVWEGLVEICRREELSVDELCSEVARRCIASSLSSALRVFQLLYFRYLVHKNENTPASAQGGLASPPQADFPGPYDYAMERFRSGEF